jgi:hypothetical protein
VSFERRNVPVRYVDSVDVAFRFRFRSLGAFHLVHVDPVVIPAGAQIPTLDDGNTQHRPPVIVKYVQTPPRLRIPHPTRPVCRRRIDTAAVVLDRPDDLVVRLLHQALTRRVVLVGFPPTAPRSRRLLL